jgi:hypothetical protein
MTLQLGKWRIVIEPTVSSERSGHSQNDPGFREWVEEISLYLFGRSADY